jgi:tetratricopeptide (TPR) repeat protein
VAEQRTLEGSVFALLLLLLCAVAGIAGQAQTAAPPQVNGQAAALVAQGFKLLDQRDAAGGEAAFRQAIEIQPELADAHRGLGMALWARGQGSAALRELNVAARLAPNDVRAHLALGKLAWTLTLQPDLAGDGKLSAADYRATALAALSKAASLQPDDAETRLTLVDVYLQTGNKSSALDEAQKAAKLAKTSTLRARAQLAVGRAYFAVGEEENAERAFRDALGINPALAEAHLGIGQLRLAQHRLPEAEQELRRAIELAPDLAAPYALLADLLTKTGRLGEARGLLEKATALDPGDLESRYHLAVVLGEVGDVRRAEELLEYVVGRQPDFLAAREQLGLSLLRRGDREAAAQQANTILARSPRAAEGHRLMALILWKQQDVEGALAECAQALAADPDSEAMAALQAVGLWKLDRKKEAQAALVQAAKAQPQIASGEVFCRLILCDSRDVATVGEFLRKNRWAVTPPSAP